MINKEVPIEIEKDSKIHSFRGVDGLKEFIHSFDDEIIVYFDPDVDGMVAGLLICRVCKFLGKQFKWYVNSNREHGWFLDLEKVSGRDIIAVDFVIESPLVSEIVDAGCNLLSIDHHVNGEKLIDITSDCGTRGLVINNQYPFEEESSRYLSGAGVVFEVFCNLFPEFNTLENRALVGLTLLSDIRDIENPYARGYLYDLYNHKYKGYIKYLINHTMGERDYGFGVPRLDRNYVDFKFSPAINSALRFNEETQVVEFFLGSGILDLSLHKQQKELVKIVQSVIKIVDFSNLRVCYFYSTDEKLEKYQDILSSFIGLVASRYLDGIRSVICYMISYTSKGKPYVKRASFRGSINGLDYLGALEGVVHGVGHPPAFGIKELIPSKALFLKINDICKRIEENSDTSKDVTSTANLSFFARRRGKQLAVHNLYCLSQHRKYVKYTGHNVHRKRSGANYIEYEVDGVSVMCFDNTLNFNNGLIMPIMDRVSLCFYLETSGKSEIEIR